ncbi:MAG: hypothetical protein WD512_19730 [Candidatus Paceibacterota bacterium]
MGTLGKFAVSIIININIKLEGGFGTAWFADTCACFKVKIYINNKYALVVALISLLVVLLTNAAVGSSLEVQFYLKISGLVSALCVFHSRLDINLKIYFSSTLGVAFLILVIFLTLLAITAL